MKKILYSSKDVKTAIRYVFLTKNPRIAITAFVGNEAAAYLPNPEGLELICWPNPGGTNPNEIRRLINLDVNVSFSDKLHMKVYWSRKGAVITSANLSTNALGSGNLRELGIQVSSSDIDIERIKKSLRIYPVTRAALSKLDREFNIEHKGRHRSGKDNQTFIEWFDSPMQTPVWKIGWWDEFTSDFAERSKDIARCEYGRDEPYQAILGEPRDYKEGEWVLQFKLLKNTPAKVSWLFIDYKVRVPSSDENAYQPDYPYEYCQVWPLRTYDPPPFRLDKEFIESFKFAVQEFGGQTVKELTSLVPSARLLSLIADRLR